MRKILLACVAMLVAGTGQVQAGLMSGNDSVFGTDSITIDSDTGLEWLDLTLSTGRSFNDVSTQFGIGGDFAGWQYATVSQVQALYEHAGITTFNQFTADQGHSTILSLLGSTSDTSAARFGQGIHHPGSSSLDIPRYSYIYNSKASSIPYGAIIDEGNWSPYSAHVNVGSFLVRSQTALNPVPEPASLAIFGIGALGLVAGGIRRRKRSAGKKGSGKKRVRG